MIKCYGIDRGLILSPAVNPVKVKSTGFAIACLLCGSITLCLSCCVYFRWSINVYSMFALRGMSLILHYPFRQTCCYFCCIHMLQPVMRHTSCIDCLLLAEITLPQEVLCIDIHLYLGPCCWCTCNTHELCRSGGHVYVTDPYHVCFSTFKQMLLGVMTGNMW
jgi:hypothetical protein